MSSNPLDRVAQDRADAAELALATANLEQVRGKLAEVRKMTQFYPSTAPVFTGIMESLAQMEANAKDQLAVTRSRTNLEYNCRWQGKAYDL